MENSTDILQAVNRVKTLTDKDEKSDSELLVSTMEELGELSREVLVEDKSFGNTYKEVGEGSVMESVDLIICALAMYFRRGGDSLSLSERINLKLNKWEKVQTKI